MDGLVAVEVCPDNAVEADEVIDMVMGQEDGLKVREPIAAHPPAARKIPAMGIPQGCSCPRELAGNLMPC